MDALLDNPAFQQYGLLVASLAVALAVAYAFWQLAAIVTYPRERLGDTHPFERQRRAALRAGNVMYRWMEPLVDELAPAVVAWRPKPIADLQRNLAAMREKLPWRADEFVVTRWLEGIAAGGLFFLVLWMAGWGKAAVLFGLLVAGVYGFVMPKSVGDKAKKRLGRIRGRLPFAVDLIALTMEAGGGFQECLATAVAENGKDHPLTEELAEVLRQISLGRPRHEALTAMQERLHDDDINEMVFAINKGEELGTPLSAILREQANQMRLKRSQRGEKAAAEAQVNIVFPGMVVMIACLLVVIAPIVLPTVLALF
jgi:tight adherence protein C